VVTGQGSVISNAPGATLLLAGPAGTLFDGVDSLPVGTFANAGLTRKLAGSDASVLDDNVLNSGTLEVQAGQLQCRKAFTQTDGQVLLVNGVLSVTEPPPCFQAAHRGLYRTCGPRLVLPDAVSTVDQALR
jgi:hypothetical protein